MHTKLLCYYQWLTQQLLLEPSGFVLSHSQFAMVIIAKWCNVSLPETSNEWPKQSMTATTNNQQPITKNNQPPMTATTTTNNASNNKQWRQQQPTMTTMTTATKDRNQRPSNLHRNKQDHNNLTHNQWPQQPMTAATSYHNYQKPMTITNNQWPQHQQQTTAATKQPKNAASVYCNKLQLQQPTTTTTSNNHHPQQPPQQCNNQQPQLQ